MGCMKLLYDAASSLIALVNKFDDNVKYEALNEMHQELLESLEESKMPSKESLDQNNDDDDDNEYADTSKNEHKMTMMKKMEIQLIQNRKVEIGKK
jgi:hypothetical protein